jgi:hypothetical protein
LAGLIGWHSGGCVQGKRIRFQISQCVWLADVKTVECAEGLVSHVAQRWTNNEEWDRNQLLNPRYGIFRWDELPRGRRASAVAVLKQLGRNEPMDLRNLVEPLLLRVEDFLAAWHAIAQSSGHDAIEPGRQLAVDDSAWLTVTRASIASGATKPEITKAANKGELRSNGKKGHQRRICKAGLTEWQLHRATIRDRVETDATVKRKLRRAEGD